MPIEALQAQAGHRSIASTQLYLHLGDGLAGRRVPAGGRGHRGPGGGGDAPMSAAPLGAGVDAPRPTGDLSATPVRPSASWDEIAVRAPQMVATMTAYLDQLAVSSRPATVAAASLALRHLAAHLTETDPDVHVGGGHRAAPHRVLQAGLGGPSGHSEASRCRTDDHPPQPGHGAHVLRADHRLGLPRRAPAGADLRRGHPQSRRAAAEVPRRPHRREVHGHPGRRPQPAPPAHGRAVGSHRHASRRAGRRPRRRHVPARRHLVAAHPGRANCTTTATSRCTRCWSG